MRGWGRLCATMAHVSGGRGFLERRRRCWYDGAAMHRIPLLRAAAVVPVWQFLAGFGAPATCFLERARIPERVIHEPEALVPHRFVAHLLEDAARREGIETLGLRMGLAARTETFGFFGRRLFQAPTLYDALETARRLCHGHHSGQRYALRQVDGEVRFEHHFSRTLEGSGDQVEQYSLGCELSFFRSVLGPSWRPVRVYAKRGLTRRIAEEGFLAGTDVVFDQEASGVAIPRALLWTPVGAPPATAPADDESALRWRTSAPAKDLPRAARQLLAELLGSRPLGLQVLADATGTSARTLQRHLGAFGTSYERLLDEARLEAAQRLLRTGRHLVGDVARELGYTDAAHLTRAFRRWTGTTPGRFRDASRSLEA